MKRFSKNKYLILQNILKYSFIGVFVLMMVLPSIINAAGGTISNKDGTISNKDGTISNKDGTISSGKTVDTNIDVKIVNPLGKISSIPQFVEALLNIALKVGVPLVAIAIIYTGFLFVTAQGNSEKLGTAKKALMYTLIGAVLILGAWILANSIVGTVEQIKTEAK